MHHIGNLPDERIRDEIAHDPRCWTPPMARRLLADICENFARRDLARALAMSGAALHIATRISAPVAADLECEAWYFQAAILAPMGCFRESEQAIGRCYAAAQRSRAPVYYGAVARYGHAMALLEWRRYDEAEALMDGVDATFAEWRDEWRRVGALDLRGYLAFGAEHYADAWRIYSDLLPLVTNPARHIEISYNVGVAAFRCGRLLESRDILLVTIETARAYGFEIFEGEALSQLAELPDEIRPREATFTAAVQIFDRLGHVGRAIRTEMEGIARAIGSLSADEVGSLCRAVQMRALGTGLEGEAAAEIALLDQRVSSLTAQDVRTLATKIPSHLRSDERALLN